MNPYIVIKTVDSCMTEGSIPEIFKNVHVLAECFDDPVMKAAALRAVLTNMPGNVYVGASGLAGFSDNNAIRTQ